MRPIETLRSFVEAWECDENDHLNIQFYFGLFEDAAAHYFSLTDRREAHRPPILTRHARFHSELRGGQLVRMDSQAARSGQADRWHLVHRLSEAATGRLAATALDTFLGVPPVTPAGEVPVDARPRSLSPEPSSLGDLAAMRSSMTHRGRLAPHDSDAAGLVFHRAIVGRFSKAAGHFWESVGALQPWLAENQLGRVALEMKVTAGAPTPAGLIELHSGALARGAKTVSFFHVVTGADRGEPIAAGEVTGLLFDQQKRRAIALPDEIADKVERLLAQHDGTG